MGPSESKRKKQNKKNENEIKNIFGFSKDGIKSCAGQDTYSFFGFEVENTNIRFMGVYDGHGDKGKEASTFIEKEIKKLVTDNKNKIRKWSLQANSRDMITKMFVDGYKNIQNLMKKQDPQFELSGSCAVSALLIDKVCYVINLGDSRAVIGGKLIDNIFAIQMSVDHKPSLPEEMERIKKSGGEVKIPNEGAGGPMRVYKLNENSPGLAVARSLGDCYGHECGVSEEPQVSYRILEDTDEFIVMGSDGIWDVMNSVEIVGYVFERTNDRANRVDKDKIAEEIVEECRKRWIIINKFKDNQVIERIKNDPTLDMTTKTNLMQTYIKNVNEQCGYDTSAPTSVVQNMAVFQSTSTEERFTGKHNIDDITCVICFFK